MKHTSRKKMLLSSIAMLLVAMMALGTATFAWFTSNPNADATGLSLKTTAATGLVIKTDTDEVWSHNATLAKDKATQNLTPVSQSQTEADKFFTATAEKASAYEKNSDDAIGASNGFYKENIYCRLSDGSDAASAADKKVILKGITITANENATMQNCIRVAVADKDNNLLGTWALNTSKANGVLTPDAGAFSPALATASKSLTVDTGLTALSANASDESNYITVYVYLDGQDGDCYSDKVGTVNAAEIISEVKVDLTLV